MGRMPGSSGYGPMQAALEIPSRRAPFLWGGTVRRPAATVLPALLLTFVAGLFPFTAEYLLFHPDERHYADAGIRMVQSGDFLTPRTAEGELRLKKPILPYWCVVAGFQTVGISPLGGRIGFLICGTAVVALAWWGASIAFSSHRAACFAAVAAMTQPALLISAPRSVPDVCLALGIQLSVCGCLLMLRDGRASTAGLATAFGGGVIAVLSKGAPGAAFLGFALAFLVWRAPALFRRDWRRWTAAGAIAVLVSGSWFVLMTARHRDELAQQFTTDQLGTNRFVAHAWQPIVQLPLCAGLLIALSAPWLLASLPVLRASESRSRIVMNPGVQLLLGWCACYCGLAAMINHVTPRYLLPAAAPLSILLGGLLAQIDVERLNAWLRRGVAVMTVCAIASLAIAALLRSGPQSALLVVLAMTALAFGSTRLWTPRWTTTGQCVLMAVMLNAALIGAGLGMSAWRGSGIAGPVSADAIERIVFAGEAAQVTQLRVSLGGATTVVAASATDSIESTDTLVLDQQRADAWDLSGRAVRLVNHGHRIPGAGEVVRFVSRADFDGLWRRIERRFVIAGPRVEADATADGGHESRVQ